MVTKPLNEVIGLGRGEKLAKTAHFLRSVITHSMRLCGQNACNFEQINSGSAAK